MTKQNQIDQAMGAARSFDYGEEQIEAALRGAHEKRKRRRVVKTVGATVAVVAIAFGVSRFVKKEESISIMAEVEVPTIPEPEVIEEIEQPPKPDPNQIVLADGSSLRPKSGSDYTVGAKQDAVLVVLTSGELELETAGEGAVVVASGPHKIRAQSARFAATRSGQRTQVVVFEGFVEIGSARISAGETKILPDKPEVKPEVDVPDWKELAKALDFEAAFKALDESRVKKADLLLAADVARAVGKYRRAAGYLERASSAAAAFTLGRLRLEKLGNPIAAAKAFATARKRAPNGPLAEDALAREAEALARGGAKDKARERAQRYLERYPDGHRRAAMSRYADGE